MVLWHKKNSLQKKDIEQLISNANQGDSNAQYNLGKCYEQGKGVAKDKKLARYWFKKCGTFTIVINWLKTHWVLCGFSIIIIVLLIIFWEEIYYDYVWRIRLLLLKAKRNRR